jgi:hypothetical protein
VGNERVSAARRVVESFVRRREPQINFELLYQ